VTALAFAIDAKDHYTQGHSQSVSRLAAQIARQIGLSDSEVEEVRLAGILHDIGKIGVPESVLHKPGLLTPEEYEVMKTHAVLGEKILEPLKVKAIAHIRGMVRHHHEHFDGRGYPDRLQGEQIPIGARLLTVADCFDTMVSDRSYKKGRTFDEAVDELRRCGGTQFDPSLVQAFVQSLEALGDPRKREAFEPAN
jgi:putative nucleotidyltransferase with HDIG domain